MNAFNSYLPLHTLARKAPPAEPQTLRDVIAEHQQSVEKIDKRLQQMNDPQWLSDRKAKLEKQKATAQHEVDILKQAAGDK